MRKLSCRQLCILFVAAVICPTAIAQGEEAESDALVLLSQMQSAKGNFEQIIREQDGYVLDRQTGEFAMLRPRKLSWKITELDQLLVSDGEQLFLYDELFEQVIVRDWSSDPTINPAAILLDEIQLEEWATVERSGQILKLTPLNRFASILQIELVMSGEFPQLLKLLDTTGQTTEIRFTEVELNARVAPELFVFEIPLGAEVIYEN